MIDRASYDAPMTGPISPDDLPRPVYPPAPEPRPEPPPPLRAPEAAQGPEPPRPPAEPPTQPLPGRPGPPGGGSRRRALLLVGAAVVLVVIVAVVVFFVARDDGTSTRAKPKPRPTPSSLDAADTGALARELFFTELSGDEYDCVAEELDADSDLADALANQEADANQVVQLVLGCLNSQSIALELAASYYSDLLAEPGVSADDADAIAGCVAEELTNLDTDGLEEGLQAYADGSFTEFVAANLNVCL